MLMLSWILPLIMMLTSAAVVPLHIFIKATGNLKEAELEARDLEARIKVKAAGLTEQQDKLRALEDKFHDIQTVRLDQFPPVLPKVTLERMDEDHNLAFARKMGKGPAHIQTAPIRDLTTEQQGVIQRASMKSWTPVVPSEPADLIDRLNMLGMAVFGAPTSTGDDTRLGWFNSKERQDLVHSAEGNPRKAMELFDRDAQYKSLR